MSKTIGEYQVITRLEDERGAEGGERFLAEGPGGTRASLWVVAAPSAEVRERIERETAIIRDLEHEVIAPVREIFDHDGSLVVVSDTLLAGLGADRIIESLDGKGVADPKAAYYLGGQLAAALARAHAAGDDEDIFGVCHGHLSPARVRIGPAGEVRLEGLGLAALAAPLISASNASAYVPPEQREGGR
ncbi:MAG: hypothetical protein KC731_36195, partial [Myxococcales bacterium]|nr:hypothetical protein [Myxococcales bacterium]